MMINSPTRLRWFNRSWQKIVLFLGLITLANNAYADKKTDYKSATKTVNGNWYDHQADRYVEPTLEPMRDNELRKNGDLLQAGESDSWFWNLLQWLRRFIGRVIVFLIYALAYAAIVVVVLLLIWGIYYATGIYIRSYRPLESVDATKPAMIDVSRIEELPFEQMQDTTDPLGVCRALARQGKFDEAILYLYGYQLLALDHARKILLHKGKTNRMYLRELTDHPELRASLNLTVDRFEHVYFGKHSLTKQEFLEAWKTLDVFHRLLSKNDEAQSMRTQTSLPAAAGGSM